jgi:RNA polymerase sigma factor (sigma-70 family)
VSANLEGLKESRQQFLAMVEDLRPDLHRFCARMTGSVADGEDVVQQALARAYYGLAELDALPSLKPWLFKIAHSCAIDFLRGAERRRSEPLDDAKGAQMSDPEAPDPLDALAREEAMQAALAKFLDLPAAQRGVIILKDVLGHSLNEIGELLELSVPGVKAALHRGRERLKSAKAVEPTRAPRSAVIAKYVALFNGRDFDGVRALLADDVKLDVVSRSKRQGRSEVGRYFTNYQTTKGWELRSAWLDGAQVIAACWNGEPRPRHFIQLEVDADRVTSIRDFIHVPYITHDAALELDP